MERSDVAKTAGWDSDLKTFQATSAEIIQGALEKFVGEYSASQAFAWRESIPLLQRAAKEMMESDGRAESYGVVLEYRLPYDNRRPDMIILAAGSVAVIELKSKDRHSRADIDQVAAYARDSRAYHRECHFRDVKSILVPTHFEGCMENEGGVIITAPSQLDKVLGDVARTDGGERPTLEQFLDYKAYSPLPSLVDAARELFHSRTLRVIWRASAATDPAVNTIVEVAKEAARTRTRHLVLLTGVPGSGKTLVGMRIVHARFLDNLAVIREGGKPTVQALYLTGNGPLSEVLQYELRKAGGGGSTFVRHIKAYLNRYIPHPSRIPPEHLLVFDEAQRAFSPEKVADTHRDWELSRIASEPDLFISICDRMPEWSVLIGLIGGGQEIHLGEEEGLAQWRRALEGSFNKWTVHFPSNLEKVFARSSISTKRNLALNLDTEIRFHLASQFHEFVDKVLGFSDSTAACRVAGSFMAPDGRLSDGMRLYLTRDLELGKRYLWERYADAPEARFGILASSRDRDLPAFGVDNAFMATQRIKIGPWFTEGAEHEFSCRRLVQSVTEFACQGLELDMAIVAWGTDLMMEKGNWTNRKARRYGSRGRTKPRDPFQMRLNAYRVR